MEGCIKGRHLFILCLLVFFWRGAASAQLLSGDIHGIVTDRSKAVLPGVTVKLSSPLINTRITTTGRSGEYRFLDLPPGSYRLSFTLEGFSEETRSHIAVGVGHRLDIDVTLNIAVMTEETEVIAEPLVLERRKAGTSTNIPYIELQSVPTARDPSAILTTVPGIQMDRVNVGGSESGFNSFFGGKGQDGRNNAFYLDGVSVTVLDSRLWTPTIAGGGYYFNFDSLEEFEVSTGGHDPSIQSGGTAINMVSRRGGNALHGSAHAYFTNDDLQDSNIPDHLAPLGLTENRIAQISEFGGEAGGPLIKDRLWLWGELSHKDIRRLALGGIPDESEIYTSTVKANVRISESNHGSFLWYRAVKDQVGWQAGPTRPPETALDVSWHFNLIKGDYFHTFSPDFYLKFMFAYTNVPTDMVPPGGTDTPFRLDRDGIYRDSFVNVHYTRIQHQILLDGKYFKAFGAHRHEIRFGGQYRRFHTTYDLGFPGGGLLSNSYAGNFFGGTPFQGAQGFATVSRDRSNVTTVRLAGAYLADTISWDRLTLNLGLRFDHQDVGKDPSSVAASEYLPDVLSALSYDGADPVFRWRDLSPRIGFSYALGQERRLFLRASYAAYADQLINGYARYDHPIGESYVSYLWMADLNGDGIAQHNEVNFNLGPIAYKNVSLDDPSSIGMAVNQVDPDLRSPQTHEIIVGAERELLKSLIVGGNFTWRRIHDLIWDPLMKADGSLVTRDDYMAMGTLTEDDLSGATRAWYDSQLGDPFSVTWFGLRPGVELAPGNGRFLTNREGFHQRYLGVEVLAQKRLSDNWMVRGSFSWHRWQDFY
ncbi:carboxypeptidase regulatory-like domain-containing protein, partial [Acidobacteriota bacterium]